MAESDPSSPALPESTFRRVLRFLAADARGLCGLFWRAGWKTAAAVTAVAYPLFGIGLALSDGPPSAGEWPLVLLVLLGYCLFYALHVGLAAGCIAVAWRLFGAWMAVPLVLVPAAVVLSVWLCSGWIAAEGREAADAFQAAAADIKPYRGGHGGADFVLLAVIIPVLTVHYSPALLDGAFLWQASHVLLTVVLAVGLGLVPSALLSTVLLSWSLVRRMRERYRVFVEQSRAT